MTARPLVAAILVVVDGLLVLAAAAAIAIVATGGFELVVATETIRAHSLRNPLLALFLLVPLRFASRTAAPFLTVPRWSLENLDAWVLLRLRGTVQRLSTVELVKVWQAVAGLAVLALAIKLINAWIHPGFFSGDDVEVQEMSFASLFAWDWTAWSLRSAFFPMVVTRPVQWVLIEAGVTDPGQLVFGARAGVAVISTAAIPLLFMLRHRQGDAAPALLATVFLTVSGLHLAFGSSVLPRPVSMVCVLAAFGCLRSNRPAAAALGGAFLGVAAAIRFSDIVFLPAAALQLILERRWRTLAVTLPMVLLVGATIQGGFDAWYWGRPFASLTEIVDYTIVRGQSSRGYESSWYYLTAVTSWSDWVVVSLAVIGGIRGHWRAALWVGVPILLLSPLPHHEPRYLVPVLPFVAMLAGSGLWFLMGRLDAAADDRQRAPAHTALATLMLVVLTSGSLLHQLHSSTLPRTDDGVSLAREVNGRGDVDTLAIDQTWRWGSGLYLSEVRRLENVETADVQNTSDLRRALKGTSANWIALMAETCARAACEEALGDLGYRRWDDPAGHEHATYEVFRRDRAE